MQPAAFPDTDGRDIAGALVDARRRTLALIADLDAAQRMGPRLPTVNPLHWELGHIAWFAERWMLRRDGAPSLRPDADALYDSIQVGHALRWDLPLPSAEATAAYLQAVLERCVARIGAATATADDHFHARYVVHHEDMHGEAIAYTRQTLGYPAPELAASDPIAQTEPAWVPAEPHADDIEVPGGRVQIGAAPADGFCFDNEQGRHAVVIPTFRMARTRVTQAQFAAFVDDGGYAEASWWCPAGYAWKQRTGARSPVYWAQRDGQWWGRSFAQWTPLRGDAPVVHVCAYEADAYCRWAGRALPTEAQWEHAAAYQRDGSRRRRPWGAEPAGPDRAQLDGAGPASLSVAALPAGDSALGFRQLIGNVWEWTADWFHPYPGFRPDPYRAYSEPWFGSHRVLRGASRWTRSRMVRNTLRNYAVPTRNDLFAGFRTCAAPR